MYIVQPPRLWLDECIRLAVERQFIRLVITKKKHNFNCAWLSLRIIILDVMKPDLTNFESGKQKLFISHWLDGEEDKTLYNFVPLPASTGRSLLFECSNHTHTDIQNCSANKLKTLHNEPQNYKLWFLLFCGDETLFDTWEEQKFLVIHLSQLSKIFIL